MSDQITPEMVEAAKARDRRLALIDVGFQVEAELRDSPTIRVLMDRVKKDAYTAFEELAELSPTDTDAVSKALVKVRTLVYIRGSLDLLLQAAENAARSVQAEDQVGFDERDD